ncbi:fatty acid desaturase [Endozoicomonas euniceicola]|uniref:Fatty acid desaturase n=1 Tax=Endozoicomonas euniceicola TaxID=1234143 RepID=A0ABY6GRW2_9GAMM|nr:fatty acid desaturase [Endozoicomonas euniceicola]UYM15490.1 fatty acid desaturase [Endozoicomonas euniceicola]
MKLNQLDSKIVRESYKSSLMPDRIATWLTGKPSLDQKPLFKLHWSIYVAAIISIFFVSYFIGFANQINTPSIFITLISWAGLVFSSRRMAAVILHQSVHDRLSGNSRFDQFIGDLVTLLMITQDYKTYKVDHCQTHHAPLSFATKYDPIVQFFSVFGINLGQKKESLYLNFLISILSPIFHLSFFITRLGYNINAQRPVRSFFSLLYIAAILVIPFKITGSFEALLITFVIPMIFMYQVSAFIEVCSEHAWFENNVRNKDDLMKDPYFYADISWGRFCGSKYPEKGSLKKALWYLEQIFYHLPVRLFILVGDLPQHDYHHRKPLCFNWTNARYNREAATTQLEDGEPEYIDIWGLHNAIEYVFTVISKKNEDYISEFNEYAKE